MVEPKRRPFPVYVGPQGSALTAKFRLTAQDWREPECADLHGNPFHAGPHHDEIPLGAMASAAPIDLIKYSAARSANKSWLRPEVVQRPPLPRESRHLKDGRRAFGLRDRRNLSTIDEAEFVLAKRLRRIIAQTERHTRAGVAVRKHDPSLDQHFMGQRVRGLPMRNDVDPGGRRQGAGPKIGCSDGAWHIVSVDSGTHASSL
jgi:hypothetical protein